MFSIKCRKQYISTQFKIIFYAPFFCVIEVYGCVANFKLTTRIRRGKNYERFRGTVFHAAKIPGSKFSTRWCFFRRRKRNYLSRYKIPRCSFDKFLMKTFKYFLIFITWELGLIRVFSEHHNSIHYFHEPTIPLKTVVKFG